MGREGWGWGVSSMDVKPTAKVACSPDQIPSLTCSLHPCWVVVSPVTTQLIGLILWPNNPERESEQTWVCDGERPH